MVLRQLPGRGTELGDRQEVGTDNGPITFRRLDKAGEKTCCHTSHLILQLIPFFRKVAYGGSKLPGFGGSDMGDLPVFLEQFIFVGQGTHAAENGDPDTALIVLEGDDLDLSDLSGMLDVGSAAGTGVISFNGDDADIPVNSLLGAVLDVLEGFLSGISGLNRQVLR